MTALASNLNSSASRRVHGTGRNEDLVSPATALDLERSRASARKEFSSTSRSVGTALERINAGHTPFLVLPKISQQQPSHVSEATSPCPTYSHGSFHGATSLEELPRCLSLSSLMQSCQTCARPHATERCTYMHGFIWHVPFSWANHTANCHCSRIPLSPAARRMQCNTDQAWLTGLPGCGSAATTSS